MQTNQSFMPTELCLDTSFTIALARVPFSIQVALIGGFVIVMLRVICAVARRLVEPPVMTVDKWHALRILARSSEAMSAREIDRASTGHLSPFMLALQLRQLEGFGLVHRMVCCVKDGRECFENVYGLAPAGRALLAGIAQLNRYGVLELHSPQLTESVVSSAQPAPP